MPELSAQEKAAEAAEMLAAENAVVTARAVRERSGVRMSVAADAARRWNERQAERQAVPAIPDDVQARFAAIWRAAFTAASAEFDEARTGWEARIERAEAEAAQMRNAVEEVERDLERVQQAADEAADRSARTIAEVERRAAEQAAQDAEVLARERSRVDRAEGALEVLTAERDRLLEELTHLRVTNSSEGAAGDDSSG